MTPASLQHILVSIRSGRFSDALGQLLDRKLDWPGGSRALRSVLLAEMFQRTGQTGQAARTALSVLKSPGLDPSLRARCHIVLGSVAVEEGRSRQALQHFQLAIELARTCGDLEHLCWAQLRLMVAMSDDAGPEAASGLLSDARRTVARLGDPHATAALHLYVAEIETKRGLLDLAAHHVRIADSILEKYPNLWLEALSANDALCVSAIVSDLDGALSNATRIMRCVEVSGWAMGFTVATSNLGHIYLVCGELDRAEQFLLDALRTASEGGRTYAGILDSLARVKLSKGELFECEGILQRIGSVGEGALSDLSYSKLGSLETRVRLLQRQGQWFEASQLAAQVIPIALKASDRHLYRILQLLRADALLMLGDLGGAVATIGEATQDYDALSLETLAEVERVAGKALARTGDVARGAARFERGVRILSHIGNVCARADAIGDYSAALWQALAPGASPAQMPAGGATTPLGQPPRVSVCLDALSPLLPADRDRAAAVLEGAASLIDFSARPELLGREVLSLLAEANCAKELALVARSAGAETDVLAWSGCDSNRAAALAAAPSGTTRLGLGTARERDIEVVVTPLPDLGSRSALLAVHKLANAAIALERARRRERERAALWPAESPAGGEHGVFAAEQMVELLVTARKIATTNVTVLVTGETGTGKEVLAHVIHDSSPRAARPFLPFNCHAVPRDMIDSQLFGHRRGAFTGAQEHFSGVIRAAEGGTLFLDEIGELSAEVQPKLLRFLESGDIHPLGESQPIKVDVRIVAATNANLDQLVADGRFREDLFYRLNVIRFRIPPLRERREEIPLLVHHFLTRFSEEFQKGHLRVAEETMEYLLLYAWPGNVRQLANEMRRLAALAETNSVLMPEHLSPEIAATRRTVPASARELAPTEVVVRLDQPLAAAVEHIERAMLQYVLKNCGGGVEQAAQTLGISRKGLYLKRQRLGLHG